MGFKTTILFLVSVQTSLPLSLGQSQYSSRDDHSSWESSFIALIDTGNASEVKSLLEQATTLQLERPIDGNTPLHLATESNQFEAALMILERTNGSTVNLVADSGLTPYEQVSNILSLVHLTNLFTMS